jgi:hypothetical protein
VACTVQFADAVGHAFSQTLPAGKLTLIWGYGWQVMSAASHAFSIAVVSGFVGTANVTISDASLVIQGI